MEQIILQGIKIQDFTKVLLDAVEEKFKVMVQCNLVPSNSVPSKYKTFLSRSETAGILRVSLPTLNKWTKQGKIKAYRIGSRVLYKPEEIEDSLKQAYSLMKRKG